jgi:hypothetical protein
LAPHKKLDGFVANGFLPVRGDPASFAKQAWSLMNAARPPRESATLFSMHRHFFDADTTVFRHCCRLESALLGRGAWFERYVSKGHIRYLRDDLLA